MNGSGTIRVLKRDQSVEWFDAHKLSAAMWRAMSGTTGSYSDAWQLAEAVDIYLNRNDWHCVSSAALFEMALKVLNRAHLSHAADAMESHRQSRTLGRLALRIRHEDGRLTFWDKAWLARLAQRVWHVWPGTGRILAGQIESDILTAGTSVVSKQEVLARLNELVSQLGLAEAVPVEPIGV